MAVSTEIPGPKHGLAGTPPGAPVAGSLHVSVVTPDGPVFEGEARIAVVPGHDDGDVAFLAGHAPYVGLMGYGVLRVEEPSGKTHRFGVYAGFVQVLENRVLALAQKAEAPAAATPARIEKDAAALAAMPSGTDAEWAEKRLFQREAEARRLLAGEPGGATAALAAHAGPPKTGH
jgi:F-type H+-transporting ATPase subunit epsilon